VPHSYIPGERLRLEAYQGIAAITKDQDVTAIREELVDRYGPLPRPVENLLEVARFRARARQAGLTDVTLQGSLVRFAPVELPDSARVRLTRLYPGSLVKAAVRTILVPRPTTARVAGTPLRDTELLDWAREVIDTVVSPMAAQAAETKGSV
jgi:transcription-repair coupling factor (superfamily II helicase)